MDWNRRSVVAGLALTAPGLALAKAVPLPSGFRRPPNAVPIVAPDPHATFFCPMRRAPVKWRALHAFNPATVVHQGAVWMLFRAEDDSGAMEIGGHTSRLGLARSDDGVNFSVLPAPVLYPDEDDQKHIEWDGGCEDPRLAMREDGTFVVTYTQFNRKAVRLGLASSQDLVFWRKHGSVFAGTRYENLMMKSAAVVHRLEGERLVAARIGCKYWMLFGQGDIHAAHSDDMIRWQPIESAPGKLKVVMAPRPGKFDSALAEAGPQPVLTLAGIVMLYNGKDKATGVYAAGRALLDPHDPTRVLERADLPFFSPELAWEKRGQYVEGTTFIEGLARFRGQWLLYYGAADSVCGVAMAERL